MSDLFGARPRRVAAVLVLVAGCGPLLVPMPARLSSQEQRTTDRGWEDALSPVQRLSHDEWLDLLVGGAIYERGVDVLDLRSEKRFSGGRVVMEVHFDRADPARDRFAVRVVDRNGATMRSETYSRDEVMSVARALAPTRDEDPARRVAREERWARIHRFFPESVDDGGAD